MFNRTLYEVVYSEAPKWIVRGALFNASNAMRSQFENFVSPLSLGGEGIPKNHIPQLENEFKFRFVDEQQIFKNFIDELLALPVPVHDTVTDIHAQKYVAEVVGIANKYIKELRYLGADLATITRNIAGRSIILKPNESSFEKNMEKNIDFDVQEMEEVQSEVQAQREEQNELLAQQIRNEFLQLLAQNDKNVIVANNNEFGLELDESFFGSDEPLKQVIRIAKFSFFEPRVNLPIDLRQQEVITEDFQLFKKTL